MRILHAAFTSGLCNNYDYFIIMAHLGADYVGSLRADSRYTLTITTDIERSIFLHWAITATLLLNVLPF